MGLLDMFGKPAMVHALAVHAPISLAFLGVPLVVLSAILEEKGSAIRWLAIAAYLGLTIAAFATVQTGVNAREALPNGTGVIEEPVWNLVHNHEEMARKVWIFSLVTAILTACTIVKSPRIRAGVGVLAVLAALATATWVALTGHYGGTMVYVHGLGTPALECKQQLMSQGLAPPAPAAGQPATVLSGPASPDASSVPAPAAPPVPAVEPAPAVPAPTVHEVSYVGEVVPILREHCYGCHGKASGLSVETIDAMLVGGRKSGPSVRAGQPEKSPLIQYVTGELQPRMPKGGEPLSQDQVSILRAWVAMGMKDDSPD